MGRASAEFLVCSVLDYWAIRCTHGLMALLLFLVVDWSW